VELVKEQLAKTIIYTAVAKPTHVKVSCKGLRRRASTASRDENIEASLKVNADWVPSWCLNRFDLYSKTNNALQLVNPAVYIMPQNWRKNLYFSTEYFNIFAKAYSFYPPSSKHKFLTPNRGNLRILPHRNWEMSSAHLNNI